MTWANEGNRDRAARMLIGIILLGAAWTVASGMAAVVLTIAGAIALTTGIVGWCPAYTACGISTRKVTPQRS